VSSLMPLLIRALFPLECIGASMKSHKTSSWLRSCGGGRKSVCSFCDQTQGTRQHSCRCSKSGGAAQSYLRRLVTTRTVFRSQVSSAARRSSMKASLRFPKRRFPGRLGIRCRRQSAGVVRDGHLHVFGVKVTGGGGTAVPNTRRSSTSRASNSLYRFVAVQTAEAPFRHSMSYVTAMFTCPNGPVILAARGTATSTVDATSPSSCIHIHIMVRSCQMWCSRLDHTPIRMTRSTVSAVNQQNIQRQR